MRENDVRGGGEAIPSPEKGTLGYYWSLFGNRLASKVTDARTNIQYALFSHLLFGKRTTPRPHSPASPTHELACADRGPFGIVMARPRVRARRYGPRRPHPRMQPCMGAFVARSQLEAFRASHSRPMSHKITSFWPHLERRTHLQRNCCRRPVVRSTSHQSLRSCVVCRPNATAMLRAQPCGASATLPQ